MKKENDFQRELKKELRQRFPGCYVLKTDPTDIQGIPDLLILHKDKWASLEVKRNYSEARKSMEKNTPPNQHIYVDRLNEMSYASYIYPENKEEILNEMERLFTDHPER